MPKSAATRSPRPRRPTPTPVASLCHLVLYEHPGNDDSPLTLTPAIVQAVHDDGSVDAWVFGPGPGSVSLHTTIPQGEGPGTWRWPPKAGATGAGTAAGRPPASGAAPGR